MAELVRFSRDDIKCLADKLNPILTGSDLSEDEKLLLLVILDVAAEHAYRTVPTRDTAEVKVTTEVEDFHEQIIQSFVAEGKQEFVLHTIKQNYKIGGNPNKPPHRH